VLTDSTDCERRSNVVLRDRTFGSSTLSPIRYADQIKKRIEILKEGLVLCPMPSHSVPCHHHQSREVYPARCVESVPPFVVGKER
jgi:hypothetical protein